MFKKLQNLLFEDEEIEMEDEEEYFEEEVKPVKKTKKEKPVIEDNFENEVVVNKPVKPVEQPKEVHVAPKPVETVKVEKKEEIVKPKNSSLGIAIDDIQEYKPKPKPVQNTANTVKPRKAVKIEANSTYEKKPVISPIFGISEKDMASLVNSSIPRKNTTENAPKLDTVISPMYGIDKDDEPQTITDTVTQPVSSAKEVEAEDNIPVFSLDDILASRDEQDRQSKLNDKTNDKKEIDKTTVMNNRNFSLFDDDEE